MMLDILVEAALKMESPSGLNERPRWLFGGNRLTGIGPAKVSDAEMEGNYGKLVDEKHQKYGLDLRDGPCDRWQGCEMDQNNLDIATLAMKTRLTMRLDICVQKGCTSTDMVMVALLAGDERISPTTLRLAFRDYEMEGGLVTVDWENFLLDNWPKFKDRRKNKQLINLFSENVQELDPPDFPEIDWDYIDDLGQWHLNDFISQ